jgi:hypothetical protein
LGKLVVPLRCCVTIVPSTLFFSLNWDSLVLPHRFVVKTKLDNIGKMLIYTVDLQHLWLQDPKDIKIFRFSSPLH